jgi:uncharacterized protein YjdB
MFFNCQQSVSLSRRHTLYALSFCSLFALFFSSALFANQSDPNEFTESTPKLLSITVTPINPNIEKGLTQQFVAVGTYTDGTTKDLTNVVTWVSNNSKVARIEPPGLVTALAEGITLIMASTSEIVSSPQILMVSKAASENKSDL